MAYDSSLPTDKDKLRLLIGDTDEADELLADAELTFLLGLGGNLYQAAAEACRAIAGKLARNYEQLKTEANSVTDRSPERYLDLATRFDLQANAAVFAVPRLAGSAPDPFFTREMFLPEGASLPAVEADGE